MRRNIVQEMPMSFGYVGRLDMKWYMEVGTPDLCNKITLKLIKQQIS